MAAVTRGRHIGAMATLIKIAAQGGDDGVQGHGALRSDQGYESSPCLPARR
jgi:hypothetical protein